MSDKRVFTIEIDGVQKAYADVHKLWNVLQKLKDVNVKVAAETGKAGKAYSDSAKKIKEKTTAVTIEDKAEKDLQKTLQQRKELDTQLAREQINANLALKERAEQLQRSIELENAAGGSLDEMRLKLESLQETYRALSEEQRNNEQVGGALLTQIQELNTTYQQLESTLQSTTSSLESASGSLEATMSRLHRQIDSTAKGVEGILNLFKAGVGVLKLFGGESDFTTKALKKIEEILVIVNALQKANNLLLKEGALLSQGSAVMEGIHAVQIKARAAATALSTSNTIAATVAQKIFNAVAMANPYVLLATGIIAIIGALVAFSSSMSDAKRKQQEFNSAVDGSRFATEQARNEYDEHARTMRDLQLEYDVLTGKVSEHEAELIRIANTANDELVKVEDEYVKKKLDLQEEYEAGWLERSTRYNIFTAGYSWAYRFFQDKKCAKELEKLDEDFLQKKERVHDVENQKTIAEIEKHNQKRKELEEQLEIDLLDGKEKQFKQLELARKKEIAEAEKFGIDITKIEQKYANKRNEIVKNYANQSVQSYNNAREKQKEIDRKNLNIIRQYEDIVNETISDEFERRRAKIDTDYDRRIKELKRRLEEEKDLTVEAREALNNQIKNLDILRQRELDKVRKDEDDYEKQKTKDELDKNKKLLDDKKKLLDIESDNISNFYDDIQKVRDNSSVTKKGIIDVEATRKNLEEVDLCLKEYRSKLIESKQNIEKYYDEQLAMYEKDSVEYKQILHEKLQAMRDFEKQIQGTNEAIDENLEKGKDLHKEYWESVYNTLKEYNDRIMEGVTIIFDATNNLLQAQLDEAKEKYDAVSEKYDELVAKKEASDSRLQDLEEEAKTARGGRLLVLRQQIESEMQANQQLASQEQDLAKQKEKLEKDMAKKEKQQKKAQIINDIIQAISNTSLGATAAMKWGFPLGPLYAGIISASGAVQVGVMAKQLAKLEDGGLLRGSSHANGGMRIEGTNIEVEGGEYVVNKESTRNNMGLIRYINSQRRELDAADISTFFSKPPQAYDAPFRRMFEEGGQLPAITNTVNIDNDSLIEAIQAIKIEPQVSVNDINTAQRTIVRVNNWSGM